MFTTPSLSLSPSIGHRTEMWRMVGWYANGTFGTVASASKLLTGRGGNLKTFSPGFLGSGVFAGVTSALLVGVLLGTAVVVRVDKGVIVAGVFDADAVGVKVGRLEFS